MQAGFAFSLSGEGWGVTPKLLREGDSPLSTETGTRRLLPGFWLPEPWAVRCLWVCRTLWAPRVLLLTSLLCPFLPHHLAHARFLSAAFSGHQGRPCPTGGEKWSQFSILLCVYLQLCRVTVSHCHSQMNLSVSAQNRGTCDLVGPIECGRSDGVPVPSEAVIMVLNSPHWFCH